MDLLALLKQLDKTQWDPPKHPVPKGPLLTRYDLQNRKVPRGDFATRTSGSTGIPVEVQRTSLSQLWNYAATLREAIWHKRDLTQTFAVIRPMVLEPLFYPTWGSTFSLLGETGPLYAHPVRGDLNSWLQKIQPGYLMTFPSILETIDLKALTRLKGIKTTGEPLRSKHPLIQDLYSSEEVGTIAIQCPDNPDAYHVMEHLVIEILDEEERPAEEGRMIVTDLTSRYLYRYDIGDWAEKGSCFCGRGLQTLRKIKGRVRNMALLPDGSKYWPRIGSLEYRDIAPVRRFQMVQIDRLTLELRLVMERPLTPEEEERFTRLIHHSIGFPFKIQFVYVDEFPAGKFEEFVNLIG